MTADLYAFETLLSVNSHEQIFSFLDRQCDQLGYDSYFYSPLLSNQGTAKLFREQERIVEGDNLVRQHTYTTYPASWVRRYQEAGHVLSDPVFRHVSSSNLPVFWASAAPPNHIVLDEARQHGLADGLAVPVCGMQGDRAVLSIATGMPAEKSQAHKTATAGLAVLTVLHVHEAIQRIAGNAAAATPRLTRRERECLLWAAKGKTTWEIANILALSERTITFHMVNATKKLNATNRRQAVVRAISLRLIDP